VIGEGRHPVSFESFPGDLPYSWTGVGKNSLNAKGYERVIFTGFSIVEFLNLGEES
jgi:hypothetical protein